MNSYEKSLISIRYEAARIGNFHRVYKVLMDSWLHYDNAASPPELLDEGGLQ